MDNNPTFTLTSYNIRKAIGRDGKRRPERIFEVLNEAPADIVILQEADFRFKGRQAIFTPADLLDQTGLVAVDVAPDATGLGWHGNMLLLRPDLRVTSVVPIELSGIEPRGAVISHIEVGEMRLTLIQTHLGLLPWHRKSQALALAAKVDPACPTVLAGDLNAVGKTPSSLAPLHENLCEVAMGPSFPTRWPCIRFDRIFHNKALHAINARVHDTPLAQQASDHLPVTAEFVFT